MFKFRKVLLFFQLMTTIGAFVCSFFMSYATRYMWDNTKKRYYYYNVSNPYFPPLIVFISFVMMLSIVAFVFSHFKKRPLYAPSIVTNSVALPLSILNIVFSALSIGFGANEVASIISTVVCGVATFCCFISIFLGSSTIRTFNQKVETPREYRYEEEEFVPHFYEEEKRHASVEVDKMYSDLKKIKELLDDNIINEREFEELKRKILDKNK